MSDAERMTHSRLGQDNPNLALWNRNETTDVFVGDDTTRQVAKSFSRGGGFSGTSANATYIVKRLTAEFGPLGKGWGIDPEVEEYREGAPLFDKEGKPYGVRETVHVLRVRFWYMLDGERISFVQYGQTTFIGANKYGLTTDEEAPKKSLTDALTKSASWIGFAADIYMGMWDDNKRVMRREMEAKTEQENAMRRAALAKPFAFITANGDIFHDKSADDWKKGWLDRIKAWVTAQKPGIIGEAWRSNEEAVESTRAIDASLVLEVETAVKAGIEAAQEAIEEAKRAKENQGNGAKPPAPRQAAPQAVNGQAAQGAAKSAAEPAPDTFDLVDENARTITVTRDARNNRSPHERWLTGWRLAVDRFQAAAKLQDWYGQNQQNLAAVGKHFPQTADEAARIYGTRLAKLAGAAPASPSGQQNGAAAK